MRSAPWNGNGTEMLRCPFPVIELHFSLWSGFPDEAHHIVYPPFSKVIGSGRARRRRSDGQNGKSTARQGLVRVARNHS